MRLNLSLLSIFGILSSAFTSKPARHLEINKNQTTFQDNERLKELVRFGQTLAATRDIGNQLEEVLETDIISNSCNKHFRRLNSSTGVLSPEDQKNPTAVADMLRCGKWIFFSANFESKMAIPENILKAIPDIFPNEAGPSYSKTGLIPNPSDPGFAVGVVQLEKSPWGLLSPATGPARGIACAAGCGYHLMFDKLETCDMS